MEENLKQQHSAIVKIALFGPESTGKTTLSKQLADYFDTVWAPEFAREYLEKKLNTTAQTCSPEDLLPIAMGNKSSGLHVCAVVLSFFSKYSLANSGAPTVSK